LQITLGGAFDMSPTRGAAAVSPCSFPMVCSFPETAKLIHRMHTGRSVRNRPALPTISKSTE
jgi:hypothetical protein